MQAMDQQARQQIIDDLHSMHQQVSALLVSVADDQDWQPDADHWSFRYVAAHMAACDKECLQARIMQIASGENPKFEFYSNTGWDFSHLDLKKSLDDWAVTRQAIIDYFRALPDVKLLLTGQHATFGAITVPDYLRIGVEHDREHLEELQQMLSMYKGQR